MTSRLARLCSVGVVLTTLTQGFAQAPAPLPQNPPAIQRPTTPAPSVTQPTPVTPPAAAAPAPAAPAAPRARPAAPKDDELVSLNLPDVDIDTVLSTLEMFTGKIMLRPSQLPPVPGGFNLKIKKQIPRSEAIRYIETILAMNNIVVIPQGDDALKVVGSPTARFEAPEFINGSALDLPPSGKIATKLFQLDFLRVQEFQGMLQGVTNSAFSAGGVILPNANAILVTDTISNLQRIEMLLQQVDRPTAGGLATKFYQLRNGAKASDIVTKLHSIITGPLQTQLGMGTSFNADDRSNQIILITDPRQFSFFDELIDKLDVKSDPNTRNEVIYLKHAKAADVATVLLKIISGQTQNAAKSQSVANRPNATPLQPTTPTPPGPLGAPAAPPQPVIVGGSASDNPNGTSEFSSLLTIVNDDRSNSIVVSGTVDDIRLLQDLIDKLDIVLAQVRIEVVIAEVTLDDNHTSGIDQLGLKLDGDRLVGFGLAATSAGISVGGSDGSAGSLASISRIGGPGSLARSLDLTALVTLNTTKRKNNTTILTVPAIVTSHGKQAIINDGETRPVITGVTSYAGAAAGATTSSQVTQQQIGTTLTVTPFIGNDGTVQLDIKQELTDVTDTVKVDGNDQYVIGTRTATSYVTAHSGEIYVLGGFRKKSDSAQTNRLGPIPIIGDLLGARTHDNRYQELIFFIRPTVLTNTAAIDNAETMEKVNKLPTRDDIKSQLDPHYQAPKKRPVLDKILPR